MFLRISQVFRSTADGETAHAFGHLKYLATVGDTVTGEPIGTTEQNLKSAIAGETYESSQMYPGFAKVAREEGFEDIAHWFIYFACVSVFYNFDSIFQYLHITFFKKLIFFRPFL